MQTTDPAVRAAFEAVYRANVDRVYGYARFRLGEDAAMDITSEVFHAAALACRDGRTDHLTVAWLMAVTRNKVADHWRRAYRDKAQRHLTHLRAEDAVSFPEHWAEDARRPAVVAALDRLPPDQRSLLVLHHVDGLTIAELAATTGRTDSAVNAALVRARRRFRSLYEGVAS